MNGGVDVGRCGGCSDGAFADGCRPSVGEDGVHLSGQRPTAEGCELEDHG